MDILLSLTAEELEHYEPFHTFGEFTEGYDDYVLGNRSREPIDDDSMAALAYDRGAECAMRRMRNARLSIESDPSYGDTRTIGRIEFKSAGAIRKR